MHAMATGLSQLRGSLLLVTAAEAGQRVTERKALPLSPRSSRFAALALLAASVVVFGHVSDTPLSELSSA